ncbi:hypothetical protein [Burkholderia gladioli]|uniref:hypothetical protein n=1 Tax=Burkholderia gladioli TaxID=28095 RepID=UPI0016411F0D|nr:hypothetical protein [Burkholderia gladioli]
MSCHDASWNRIRVVLLGSDGMSVRDISVASGIPLATVHDALTRHCDEVRVVQSRKTKGPQASVWALYTAGVPELSPAAPRDPHWRMLVSSPFAVAAGAVAPLQTVIGRVYRQDMDAGGGADA